MKITIAAQKEDKLIALYSKMEDQVKKTGDAYALEWCHAIEDTLSILEIKVEGINK